MRNLIYTINLTVDGCVDHTRIVPADDTFEYFIGLTRSVDLQVFGRKTYQLMVPYWPDVAKDPSAAKAHREFAEAFNAVNKLVFSRTLESVEDGNTRIVRSDLHDEIVKSKHQPGRDILVGGVDLPSQLVELGLVDEFRFVISPFVAGAGRRLLDGVNLRETLPLKLVESATFKSGCVVHRYVKS